MCRHILVISPRVRQGLVAGFASCLESILFRLRVVQSCQLEVVEGLDDVLSRQHNIMPLVCSACRSDGWVEETPETRLIRRVGWSALEHGAHAGLPA